MQLLKSLLLVPGSERDSQTRPVVEGFGSPSAADGSDPLSITGFPDADFGESGYIFHAAKSASASSNTAAVARTPPDGSVSVDGSCPVAVAADKTAAAAPSQTAAPELEHAQGPNIERPDPVLAQEFLSRVGSGLLASGGHGSSGLSAADASLEASSPPQMGAPAAADGLTPAEGYKRFAMDLAPYFIAEYAAQGVDVNIVEAGRAQQLGTRATSPWLAAVGASVGVPHDADSHDFTCFVVPLLQKHRPSLAHAALPEVALVLQPESAALQAACTARDHGEAVPLLDLLYDDAFVHSLLNWRLQPSRQALTLMKFILDAVCALHAAGRSHGELSLQSVLYSVARGWHLAPSPSEGSLSDEAAARDREAVARLVCFVCLPPDRRKQFQPHRFTDLGSDVLLRFVEHIPALKIMASALIRAGGAALEQARSFYLWHDLQVQAQVINDAKSVIRSMRIGSEEFDRRYNRTVLSGTNWRDALGPAIVHAIVAASRELVNRRDFSPYDFASAASLVRFAANTVGHFAELPLGLAVSRAAFVQVLLAAFPALVPCCYHYLASCPSSHVHNRDSDLVFSAIVASADDTHRLIHDALAGCLPQGDAPEAAPEGAASGGPTRVWDLTCLADFHPVDTATDDSIPPQVIESFAAWKCPQGEACAGLADSSCTFWHDERELRFAQTHLCTAFMEDQCKRTTCPNAHGFAEIRGAMNDTSPICWKWLESNCKVPHCRYAHTFRRLHGDRVSRDSSRTSISLDSRHRTPRNSADLSGDRRAARASTDSRRSGDQKRGQNGARRSLDVTVAPGRGTREAKSFEARDRSFQAAAPTVGGGKAPWGRSGLSWVRSSEGAGEGAARAEEAMGALELIEESGWIKAPTRRSNGRNSVSIDRPPASG